MEFLNPIKFSGLKIKKFLMIIFLIQMSLLASVYIDSSLTYIPLIRGLISFTYLCFVPGALIIRTIKLRNLSNIESFLYTIGTSLTFLMLSGVILNFILPIFSISTPLSINNLLIFLTTSTLVLCILSYKFDDSYVNEEFISINEFLYPEYLFMIIIPFLSIFAAYALNYYNSVILMIVTLIIILLTFIYLSFKKNISNNLYVIAIFALSITLLYHKSLITGYIFGTDIHIEHYLANLVVTNLKWNSNINLMYNSMISVVILGPIFSIVTGLNLHIIFKVIYPFFTALIPLGLYQVYKTQSNKKFAFLSIFLFISTSTFYGMLLEVARQQIAELFFVLLILLITNKSLNIQKSFLLVLFAFSMTFSHYGLNYLFLAVLGVYLILKFIGRNLNVFKISDLVSKNIISSGFIILLFVFSLFWYMYTSGSITFNEFFSGFFSQFLGGISDIFNPDKVEGLYIIQQNLTFTRDITKYLYLISQFFIFIGLFFSLFKIKALQDLKFNFNSDYIIISSIFLLILIMSLILPGISSKMSTYRTYHIALFFLAPFFVLGILYSIEIIKKLFKKNFSSFNLAVRITTIFLIVYFTFNSGLVNHALNENPSQSIALNPELLHPLKLTDAEYYSTIWLNNKDNDNSSIYVDNYGKFVILNSLTNIDRIKIFTPNNTLVSNGSYIYLSYLNSIENQIETITWEERGSLEWNNNQLTNSIFYNQVILKENKIYDNNISQIFYDNF